MYKKIAVFAALLFAGMQYTTDTTPWIEIKPSYFLFSASPMNEIYDHGGFQVQGSVSFPLHYYLDLYSSIGYRHASGHALNSDEQTTLAVVPFDIGLRPLFNFCERFYYFFATGPRFFAFQQQNDSAYVTPFVKAGGIGFFVNTGFEVLLADHFLLGVFGEYSYEKKTISSNKSNVLSNGPVQMGGFAFGLSLGYAF